MTMDPTAYFTKLRGNKCEACGHPFSYYRPAERHHAIEKRRKNYPELDDEINIEIVCRQCHVSGELDTEEHAIEFVKRQIARGYDVLSWYENLSLKTRRFPNLENML